MKTLITILTLFLIAQQLQGQVINLETVASRTNIPAEVQNWVDRSEKDPKVIFLQLLEINARDISWSEETLAIQLLGTQRRARRIRTDRRSSHDQSWLGLLEDETTIFFTIQKDKIAAKFYFDDMPMTLIPVGKKHHALIGYDLEKWPVTCGNDSETIKTRITPMQPPSSARTFSTDDICNMRVLAYITTEAESELPPDLTPAMLLQMGVDESNVAYAQSGINLNMELAGVLRTSYQEVDLKDQSNCQPVDLEKFKNGDSPFEEAHTARNFYRADVMILIRRDDWQIPDSDSCSSSNLYGIAYHVATYDDQLSEDRAFAAMTWDGITVGRFTAAHEIGHLQGARHENHNASPSDARGFLSSNAQDAYRTIMTRGAAGGGCSTTQGCRIQYFSDPNILWMGNPTGTASRNNAARINETADTIRGHRLTPLVQLLSNISVEDGLIANHVAKSVVLTGNSVQAEAGSHLSIRASNFVRLQVGFHAKAGSTVACRAQPDACGELPPDIFNPMQSAPPPDPHVTIRKRK